MEGDNRNLGVYYNRVPANGPDNDSIEIRLEPQGLNVTPNLRLQNTRMVYDVPGTTPSSQYIEVTMNSPINWEDCTLHTLLLDNSSGSVGVLFTFSTDYIFREKLLENTQQFVVLPGNRVKFYLSIISGIMYMKFTQNSDAPVPVGSGGIAAALGTILTGP